jgi:hypothetical protein
MFQKPFKTIKSLCFKSLSKPSRVSNLDIYTIF